MILESELQLLCETFRKCRVQAIVIHPGETMDKLLDERFRMLFGGDPEQSVDCFLRQVHPQVIYRMSTALRIHYIFLELSKEPRQAVLAIGPYLSSSPGNRLIFEIGEKFHISPNRQRLLESFYAGIPVIPDSSHLFALLDTFGEHLWGSNSFSVEDINEDFMSEAPPMKHTPGSSEDLLFNMKLMEERYAAENELMRAVSKGQVHKGAYIMEGFSSNGFEKRLDDPLRNLKNYSVIMNTLLRKAAEKGGVHPLYLNDISSAYASKIESSSSLSAMQDLMVEMFRSYCLLVRKHTMKNYSPTIQKTILLIDSDLSADLSLSTLAQAQNVSPGYLSTLFKRETGKTLTEYIQSERMQLATHLLETTSLQIQTVALHCGIMDVQYFSKIFRKYIGKTPKEYRESLK